MPQCDCAHHDTKPRHWGSAVQGPSWVFLNEWSWVRGNVAVPTLIHTFYLIYTQTTHSHGPLCIALTAAADDYYRVLVTLQPCTVSISQTEDLPPPGKTHLDLIWGKICLLREKEEVSSRRRDCSLASAAWFNLAADSVSVHLYSSYFGRWVRVSAKEGEMEGGQEEEVFVYRGRGKGNCGVLNDHLTNTLTVNGYHIVQPVWI